MDHYDRPIAPTHDDPVVTESDSPAGTSRAPQRTPGAPRARNGSEEPLSTLRGASPHVDVRKAAHIALGLVLVTLAVLVIVFVVVGIDKNRQINELRQHGVAVTFTVSNCQGLLGGSGSNGAGYACRGTYRLDGRTYEEPLPGTSFFVRGATVPALAVPGDPRLVSPVSIVDSERASSKVFVLPAVLFAALLLIGGAVLLVRRRRAVEQPTSGPG